MSMTTAIGRSASVGPDQGLAIAGEGAFESHDYGKTWTKVVYECRACKRDAARLSHMLCSEHVKAFYSWLDSGGNS